MSFGFTLFDICLSYIVDNIYTVESFNNFPDVIGEKIFEQAQARELFTLTLTVPRMRNSWERSLQALRLFSSAYEEHLLTEMNIRSGHVMLANYIEHLQLFRCLKKLDLGYCGLGDDHELLAHIAKLDRLQVLVLSGNALSDDGLRRMTAPMRVMQRGPLSIQALDLSDNPRLTATSLRYLQVFQHLAVVRFSATKINHLCREQTQQFAQSHPQNLGVTDEYCSHIQQALHVENKGWAALTVKMWLDGFQNRPLLSHVITETERFYGKRRNHSISSQSGTTVFSEELLLVSRFLCSCRTSLDQPSLSEKPTATLQRRCRLKQQSQSKISECCHSDDNHHSFESHKTNLKWNNFSEEDIQLLQQYT